MKQGTCATCGQSFTLNAVGRPRLYCDAHRVRAKYSGEYRRLRDSTLDDAIGTPCRRCGLPMDDPAAMDLGHDDVTGEIGGWEHSFCNRSAGAAKGNAMRRGKPPTLRGEWRGERSHFSRDW